MDNRDNHKHPHTAPDNQVDSFLKSLHDPADQGAERGRATNSAAAFNATPKITRKEKKKRKKTGKSPWWKKLLKAALYIIATLSVVICAVAVWMAVYLVQNTKGDEDLLDLDVLPLSYATRLMAFEKKDMNNDGVIDENEGEWIEYQRIYSDDNRVWVSYSDMQKAPALVNAVVASEDHRFWAHTGVDVVRTGGALVDTALKAMGLKGIYGETQGGSTITQQLIKNISHESDASGTEGILRKVREIYRAFQLERRFSKEQVLEAYLNTANYGGQIGGIEAAANYYFGKHTEDLTAAECAAILCITKFPTANNPFLNPDKNRQSRNDVLYSMSIYVDENGNPMLTPEEYAAALEESNNMDFSAGPYPNSMFTNRGGIYSDFTDVAIDEILQDLTAYYMSDPFNYSQEKAKSTASDKFYNGGLTIELTVDPFVQAVMEDTFVNGPVSYSGGKPNVVELDENGNIKLNTPNQTWDKRRPLQYENVPEADLVKDESGKVMDHDAKGNPIELRNGKWQRLKDNQPHASAVVMDYEGHLIGIVGDRGVKTESLTHGRYAADPAKIRSVGSSFKPLAGYGLALDYDLINFSSPLMDAPVGNRGGPWPQNYGGGLGSKQFVTVSWAIQVSLNTTAVRAQQMVGAQVTYDFLVNTLGFTTLTPQDIDDGVCLGSFHKGVRMYEVCAAFTIYGNDGTFHEAHSYRTIRDNKSGEILVNKEASAYQTYAVSPQTARIMNRLMYNVVHGGTGGAGAPTSKDNKPGLEYVAKTGTATGYYDSTYIGMNPYYCCFVWEGMKDWVSLRKFYSWTEPKVVQMVFRTIMSRISYNLKAKSFPKPAGIVEATYCQASGLIASSACTKTGKGYYKEGHLPDGVCPHGFYASLKPPEDET